MAMSNLVSVSVGYPMPLQIILKNTQNVDSPSPFQQMLQLEVSEINSVLPKSTPRVASDFHNVRFKYNYSYIPAWLESISNGIATIWVNIPRPIPANSSITIDMEVNPSLNFDGVYWGEAPQLSSTYAEYDNGVSVFNFYDNFKGTILSSVWTAPPGSNYQINNGFIATPSGGATTAIYNSNVQETSSIIAEWCLNMSSTSYPGTNSMFQLNRYTSSSNMHFLGVSGSDTLVNNGVGIATVSILSIGIQVFGIWNDGTKVTWYYEGNSYTDTSTTTEIDYLALGWAYNGQTSNFPTIYWVRTRAYPPNGVMPSVEVIV